MTDAPTVPPVVSTETLGSLRGHFLIAMPSLGDERFFEAVIYLFDHSKRGAMGVIINKIFDALAFDELLTQLDVTVTSDVSAQKILYGGPVEIGRGFVTHSTDVMLEHSVKQGDIAVTASVEMLHKIADGTGPRHTLFTLGYAGWEADQLEQELRRNDWLTMPARPDILFDVPLEKRWQAALNALGVPWQNLSAASGRA
jgi:putative transcriptional regulator